MKLLIFLIVVCGVSAKYWKNKNEECPRSRLYNPDWKDLDSRPLPQWYDEAKIGVMVHWGVYSVPSIHNEWFWHVWHQNESKEVTDFMNKNYEKGFTYQDFAPLFTAEFFDPKDWSNLFVQSGAKYVVLTAKHHDGYSLFPSKHSFGWNSVDIGPKLDLVKALPKFLRKSDIKFGVYYSLYEWYNPLYLDDLKAENTTIFTDYRVWTDIKQILNDYKPLVLRVDGDWEVKEDYWKAKELLAWIYNESPDAVYSNIVVNDRWGDGTNCLHGDFFTCKDTYNRSKYLCGVLSIYLGYFQL